MCWVQTAAGHSAGDSSASSVQEAGPTTRAPAARYHQVGGRNCAKLHHWHLLLTWYPSRGKLSAQQCAPCAGQGLTSHSPRAGEKWGTGPISPTESEMEKGERLQLHHSPGSLPLHTPGDGADMGTTPHSAVGSVTPRRLQPPKPA